MPDLVSSQILQVVIRSREKIFFDGDANAVTSKNEKGVFDILPGHSNFISVINDFVSVHKRDKTTYDLRIRDAILRASADTVHIFLGIITHK